MAELPEAKGTYILIAFLPSMKRLEIGRLGVCYLTPGFYAYVGSAWGPGGLRARLRHHLESVAQPHWHIDYLLAHAEPVEVWYALSDRKLERALAEVLERSSRFRMPIPRFGASDYHRSRTSHLFYSKRRPSFQRFQEEVKQAIGEPPVLVRGRALQEPGPPSSVREES
jgi:Uri superfamily endonuclease